MLEKWKITFKKLSITFSLISCKWSRRESFFSGDASIDVTPMCVTVLLLALTSKASAIKAHVWVEGQVVKVDVTWIEMWFAILLESDAITNYLPHTMILNNLFYNHMERLKIWNIPVGLCKSRSHLCQMFWHHRISNWWNSC